MNNVLPTIPIAFDQTAQGICRLWAYCGRPVGMARRSEAKLGSVASIFDDLRLIRSRGGFRRAVDSDFAGSLANSSGEADVDVIRLQLEDFVDRFLENESGSDQELLDGSRLAAAALRILLFNDGSRLLDFDLVRTTLGQAAHRSSDHVRTQENALLRRMARTFWSSPGSGASSTGPAPARAADELDAELERDIREATDAVLKLRLSLLDVVVEVARVKSSTPFEPTGDFQAALVFVVYRLANYLRCREAIVFDDLPPAMNPLSAVDRALLPRVLASDSPESERYLAELLQLASATEGDPREFLRRLTRRGSAGMAFVDALSASMWRDITRARRGEVIDDEVDLCRMVMAAHDLEKLYEWLRDEMKLKELPKPGLNVRDDIYWLIVREHADWKEVIKPGSSRQDSAPTSG